MESSTACTAPPWTSRILLHDLIKLLGRAHELHLEKTWTSFEDLNGHGIGWKINERPPFLYPRCVTWQSEFSTKICKEDYASHVLKKPREEGVALDIQEHWRQMVPPENIALSNKRWFAHMSHTNRGTHTHTKCKLCHGALDRSSLCCICCDCFRSAICTSTLASHDYSRRVAHLLSIHQSV